MKGVHAKNAINGYQEICVNVDTVIMPYVYLSLSIHTKFTFYVFHLASCPEIDDFIYFLSRNDIQHFVLNLPLGKMFDKSSKEKKRRRIPSSTIFFCM